MLAYSCETQSKQYTYNHDKHTNSAKIAEQCEEIPWKGGRLFSAAEARILLLDFLFQYETYITMFNSLN